MASYYPGPFKLSSFVSKRAVYFEKSVAGVLAITF